MQNKYREHEIIIFIILIVDIVKRPRIVAYAKKEDAKNSGKTNKRNACKIKGKILRSHISMCLDDKTTCWANN